MDATSRERWWDLGFGAALIALLGLVWLAGGWEAVGFCTLLGPMLPVAALLPWYFVARHRGLVPRSALPCTVTLADGVVALEGPRRKRRVPLDAIASGRFARNDNWTESKLLDDALTLFDARGRTLVRIPLSARGVDELELRLRQRSVALEELAVSAPAFLD